VLCGRHPVADDLRGALQEMNQATIIKPVAKWAETCYQAQRIPEYLATAFRQAAEGRPGPVFLELPANVVNEKVDEERVPLPARPAGRLRVRPQQAALAAAAALVNRAERPLLVGGSGVRFSACADDLAAFVQKSGMPFQLLNYGRGELPDSHPLSLWDAGPFGLMTAISQADVLVVAGLRLNWLFMYGQVIPPETKVIRIDIDPHEVDRNRAADVGLAGDVGAVLGALLPLTQQREHPEWVTGLRATGLALLDAELRQRETASDPIHPVRLVGQIQKAVGEDAYYVVDGGDTSYFGLAGFMSRHPAGVIGSAAGLFGCLGTGSPFAMAARLAHPERPVILLNGDGSFGFNAMEFDTMVRHGIPLVCVVNNDCAWGMIKHSQELSIGKQRLVCSELGMRHYQKVVESLGGHGELVTRDEEIIPAIQRALASNKPACVNAVTDPTVTSPPTLLLNQALGAGA
jgi:acetolactate synthase-1/2/3 large subunit